jgi:Phosphodiester glycosidase
VLAPSQTPLPTRPPPARFSGRGPNDPARRAQRVRRIALIAGVICLVPALISWVEAVTAPGGLSVGVNTVEWMRENGARGLVDRVENIYYSLTAPSKGGPALRALPTQPGTALAQAKPKKQVQHVYRPHNIRPVIHPALPGEGVWRATFKNGGSRPPVLITSFRPDPDYPQLVAGVAWIDHTRTSVRLYPGLQEPDVALPSRGPAEVPMALRGRLVATFNSGFRLQDSGGGFASNGHTYAPLVNGLATIVRYQTGRVDVIAWNGGPNAGPDVVYARQNLPLIVNHGQPNPNLSDGPEWGATLGNAIQVWRSAVGIDRHGNLIYAAANDQTVGSIAAIMIRAGAVRAMELDINTEWTSFITYRFPGAGGAANLLPDMERSPQRYLVPDDRDFFAVYLR